MKRVLLILAPAILFLGTLYGLYKYFEKDLQGFVLLEMEKFSEENLPVRIRATSFEYQLISPSVQLNEISITAKDPAQLGFTEIKVSAVRAHLDFLQALGGKLFLSSLVIKGTAAQIQIDPFLQSEGESAPINWKKFFDLLKGIPLYRLVIVQSELQVISEKLKLDVQSKDLDLMVFNQKDLLTFKIDAAASMFKFDKIQQPFQLRGSGSLNTQKLKITEVALETHHTQLRANGDFSDIANLLRNPQAEINWKLASDLEKTSSLLPDLKMHGSLEAFGQLQIKKGLQLATELQLQGQDINIAGFQIGGFQTNGNLNEKKLKLNALKIANAAGDVDISELELAFEDFKNVSVEAKVSTEMLDVHTLLQDLSVGDLPLEAFVGGEFKCSGPVFPRTEINCRGSAEAEHFEVRSGPQPSDTIAAIREFKAKGDVTITQKDVSYKAELEVKDDKGESDGVISYSEGFKIRYATPLLKFSNVRNLANLKLEGQGKLSGSTSGDSNAATFQMGVEIENFYLEDFRLGSAKGQIRYEKGNLAFDSIQGQLGTTRYSARVGLDLKKSRIKIEGQMPSLELSDAFKAVERKFQMPIEITGLGSAFFRGEGPLALNQLTYQVSAQAFRGTAAGESFDRFQGEMSAVKGEVKVDRFTLSKNSSTISMRGVGHPNGEIDLNIKGERLLLEDSENVSKLGSSLSGNLNFQMGLTGHILNPDLVISGALSQLVIEEQEFPNSFVDLNINKKNIEGTANLLGKRLQAEFKFPLIDGEDFKFKAKATDWNFTTMFALIGGASLIGEYQASLTGQVDLSSERGGFFKASGKSQIDKFILKRGSLNLNNTAPMEFYMKSGLMSFNNFSLTGDQSRLEVRGQQFTSDDLRLSIDGNVNLRLLHIFVPFLEEIGGNGKISVRVTGPVLKPEVLGSAIVEQGFARIKGFPHPFERVQADLDFSASKVLVKKVTGNLAGGNFKGDGQIQIEGPKNFPINIAAKVDGANLNVPDGIRTLGDADIAISGSWFPFLLSGTYRVRGGLVDKEFGGDSGLGNLKQSSYLPKVILQSAFEPILLDMQVQIENPLIVKNSLMDGSLLGNVQIKGPPTQPTLVGRLQNEKGSKLIFRDKLFELQSGIVTFRNTGDINPELYFAGRSRVSEYDVSLLVQGTAKDPVLRLNSVPPLAEPDIISLLALGLVASDVDKRTQSTRDAGNQAATAAAGDAFFNYTSQGKELQKKLGLNIKVSSSFDDTKNTTSNKITVSRKLNEKIVISGSSIQGQESSKEVKLRYLINNNLSTVGTFEQRESSQEAGQRESLKKNDSVIGIDLEFQKEFK